MPHTQEFLAAVKDGKLDRVRALLEENTGLVNLRNEHGVPVLMLALYQWNEELVSLLRQYEPVIDVFEAAALGEVALLKAGPGRNRELLNAYSPDGWTPMHLAAFFGRTEALEYLLTLEPDLEAVSKNQTAVTPLQSALSARELELARKLLQAGADPNASADPDHRPLFYAVNGNNLEMARLLLEHGANLHFANSVGLTPLEVVEKKGRAELAEVLRGHGSHH